MILLILLFSDLLALPRTPYDRSREVFAPPAIEKESQVQEHFRRFRSLKPENHPLIQKISKTSKIKGKDQVIIRVLALRVEFQEEIPDDPKTTGSGIFQSSTNGENPILGLDCNGRPYYNPFYDPPHDWVYFNNQMMALASYVYAATYGKVRLEWVVKPDSGLPPYRVPHKIAYYGDTSQMELGLVTFLRDAFRAADNDPTVNFEDLDNNGIKDYLEGIWDRYIIFHAGSAWQTDMAMNTPYDLAAVTIPPGALEYYLGRGYLVLNEGRDTVYDACILPETMSQDGVEIKLQGTLFHESGHNLFLLPDLYDTYGRGAGIGAFGIMTTGPYLDATGIPSGLIPPMPNAWERIFIDYILRLIFGEGFLDERIVKEITPTTVPQEIKIYPLSIPVDSFAIHKTPSGLNFVTANFFEDPYSNPRIIKIPINSKEYFIIQNLETNSNLNDYVSCGDSIKVSGKWRNGVVTDFNGENDYLLPGDGLLVFHIDDQIIWENYAYNTINAVRPMGVYILEADHVQDFQRFNWDLSPYAYCWFGSPYDLYFKGNNTVISSTTLPASVDNLGNRTNIKIYDVSEKGNEMSFRVVLEKSLPPFPIRAGYSVIDSTSSHMILDESYQGFLESKDSLIIVLQNIYRKRIIFANFDTSVVDSFALLSVVSKNGNIILTDTLRNLKFTEIPAIKDINEDGYPEFVCVTDKRKILFYSTLDSNLDNKPDLKFQATIPETIVSPPSILNFGNQVFIGVGAFDNKYYFIDTLGNTYYTLETGSPARNIPATNGHILFYQSVDGRLLIMTDRWEAYSYGDANLKPSLVNPVLKFDSTADKLFLVTATGAGDHIVYDERGTILKYKKGIPLPVAGISMGDIDGDGYNDQCFIVSNYLVSTNQELSLLSGFPIRLDSTCRFYEPLLVDIDNDGREEMIISCDKGIHIYGYLKEPLLNYFSVGKGINSQPCITDLNGDGSLELSYITSDGYLYVQELNATKSSWKHLGSTESHNPYLVEQKTVPSTEKTEVSLFYIYPNPVTTPSFNLRFKASRSSKVEVSIYNFAGQKIKSLSFNASGNVVEEKTIYAQDMGPDVYTLVAIFDFGDKKVIKKVRFTVSGGDN
jgi:M6 family metalloprotease-like protein